MALMATSQSGLDLIKSFEGFRGHFYYDQVGAKTIGYGHACHGDGTNCANVREPMTESEGLMLLAQDLKPREECVATAVNTPLSDNAFSALVSFAFNIGCEAFKQSPVLKFINHGDFGNAVNALRAHYFANGIPLEDLRIRRQAEATLLCFNNPC